MDDLPISPAKNVFGLLKTRPLIFPDQLDALSQPQRANRNTRLKYRTLGIDDALPAFIRRTGDYLFQGADYATFE